MSMSPCGLLFQCRCSSFPRGNQGRSTQKQNRPAGGRKAKGSREQSTAVCNLAACYMWRCTPMRRPLRRYDELHHADSPSKLKQSKDAYQNWLQSKQEQEKAQSRERYGTFIASRRPSRPSKAMLASQCHIHMAYRANRSGARLDELERFHSDRQAQGLTSVHPLSTTP